MNNKPESVGGLSSFNNGQYLRGGVTRRIEFTHTYEDITSVDNLLAAWKEFVRGKHKKQDVQEFSRNLLTNVLALNQDLVRGEYWHSPYQHFKINDPKPRDIHKASVRDRLLHHALYRQLYPFFDRTFIADSYSCRKEKGTHKAMNRFRTFAYQISKNNTHTCWVLKCDIRKFFASIDQSVLMDILSKYTSNPSILELLSRVIESFSSTAIGKGLPLGNLTSQLLVNIYMNEFDQFVKHKLKAKYYIRYADDFVFLSSDRKLLESLLPQIREFLRRKLKLELHPDKVSIATLASGIDFLGWVHFFDHRVLRTTTKKRAFRTLKEKQAPKTTVASYLGLLSHGNAWQIKTEIKYLADQLNPEWSN